MYLGIDIGTSSVKSVLVDERGATDEATALRGSLGKKSWLSTTDRG